jgi:hypothetical protein
MLGHEREPPPRALLLDHQDRAKAARPRSRHVAATVAMMMKKLRVTSRSVRYSRKALGMSGSPVPLTALRHVGVGK